MTTLPNLALEPGTLMDIQSLLARLRSKSVDIGDVEPMEARIHYFLSLLIEEQILSRVIAKKLLSHSHR